MPDITTQYLGLTLRNPIIVGSSGLTASVERIRELERAGAGAVVLKSIFEEEILAEAEAVVQETEPSGYALENYDYLDYHIRGERLDEYKRLVAESKKAVSIPVIASVNCVYAHEWAFFAQELEAAGADALELNMFFLPSDFRHTAAEKERAYFEVIERVLRNVSLPVALKISYYFTDLGPMIQRLSKTGIAGLVLFNRFYSPDFDLDKLQVVQTNVLSTPAELPISLRWIAIMAGRVDCDLCASTGIHDGRAVIKQILAGANAVQVASALYRNGIGHLQTMLDELQDWMTSHEYYGLEMFRGKMSQAAIADPAVYERVQFMKYFG